jgi:hypothetical protein
MSITRLPMTLTKPRANLTKPSPSRPPLPTAQLLTATGVASTSESAVCRTATRSQGKKTLKGESRQNTPNAVNAKPQIKTQPHEMGSAGLCDAPHPRRVLHALKTCQTLAKKLFFGLLIGRLRLGGRGAQFRPFFQSARPFAGDHFIGLVWAKHRPAAACLHLIICIGVVSCPLPALAASRSWSCWW